MEDISPAVTADSVTTPPESITSTEGNTTAVLDQSQAPIAKIPTEILQDIATYLPLSSRALFAMTSKYFLLKLGTKVFYKMQQAPRKGSRKEFERLLFRQFLKRGDSAPGSGYYSANINCSRPELSRITSTQIQALIKDPTLARNAILGDNAWNESSIYNRKLWPPLESPHRVRTGVQIKVVNGRAILCNVALVTMPYLRLKAEESPRSLCHDTGIRILVRAAGCHHNTNYERLIRDMISQTERPGTTDRFVQRIYVQSCLYRCRSCPREFAATVRLLGSRDSVESLEKAVYDLGLRSWIDLGTGVPGDAAWELARNDEASNNRPDSNWMAKVLPPKIYERDTLYQHSLGPAYADESIEGPRAHIKARPLYTYDYALMRTLFGESCSGASGVLKHNGHEVADIRSCTRGWF